MLRWNKAVPKKNLKLCPGLFQREGFGLIFGNRLALVDQIQHLSHRMWGLLPKTGR